MKDLFCFAGEWIGIAERAGLCPSGFVSFRPTIGAEEIIYIWFDTEAVGATDGMTLTCLVDSGMLGNRGIVVETLLRGGSG